MNQDTAAQTEASPAAGAAPPRRSRVMRLRTSRPVVFVIHGTPLGWPLRWLWSLARADDTRARLGDLDEWKEELSTKTMAKVVRRVDDFEAVELRLLAVEEALVALSQRANALEAELRSLSGGSPGIGSPETGGLAVEAASGREAPLLDVPLVWASDVNETAGVAAPPASRLSNPGPTGRRRSRPAPFSAPSTRCEAYARYVAPGRHPAAFLDLGSGTDDLRRALLDRGIPVATPRDRAGPGAIDLNVPVGTLSEAEAIAFLRSSGAPASGVLLSQFGGYLTPGNLAQFVTAAHARLASGGVLIVETPNARQTGEASTRPLQRNAAITEDLLLGSLRTQGFGQLRRLFSAPTSSRAPVAEDPASWYLNVAVLGWKP